jgi:hypothetical protein
MPRFVDADDAFMEWAQANSEGFVLNVERRPRASYLVLHRATCGQIIDRRVAPGRRTAEYIKVCSVRRGDLETWARVETGGDVQPCSICAP